MELDDDTVPRGSTRTPEDPDLREDRTRSASQRWWSGAIVALDLIAIIAFVALVVIPILT